MALQLTATEYFGDDFDSELDDADAIYIITIHDATDAAYNCENCTLPITDATRAYCADELGNGISSHISCLPAATQQRL